MVDITADMDSTGEVGSTSCLYSYLGVHTSYFPTAHIGELEQCPCLYSYMRRLYAIPTSLGELEKISCLQNAGMNLLRAFTQPSTTISETNDIPVIGVETNDIPLIGIVEKRQVM